MSLNLVTKQEYKAYSGIKSDTQDSSIDVLIPKVSNLVKNYCNRSFVDFVDDPKTETFSGGEMQYIPQETPIISVLSLQKSEDYGRTYTNLVNFTDYVLDQEQGTIYSLSPQGFDKRVNGYRLNYFAGYEQLPEDLKLVVFDLVTFYMKNDAVSHMQKTTASGGLQLEYLTSAQFPSHIARVLNLYKINWG